MATQHQLELEARLPEASPNLCAYLWANLKDAGLAPDADTVRFIGRIVSDYIKNTEDGKTTVFKLLQTQLGPATPDKTYYQTGRVGEESAKIPYSELLEYRGWIYRKAVAVPHSSVTVIGSSDNLACDDCGIMGPKEYCVQQVLTLSMSGRQDLQNLCNNCRTFSADPKVRDLASPKICSTCPKTACDHYPHKNQMLLLAAPIERR